MIEKNSLTKLVVEQVKIVNNIKGHTCIILFIFNITFFNTSIPI
jgi:hypothetical protein